MAAQQLTTTGRTFAGLHQRGNGVEHRQLNVGEVQRLKRQSQVIRVESGHAWITHDGKDIVLKGGDELTLNRGKDSAVISSAGRRPVTFEVR